jgi:fumarate hydratase class I
MARAEGKLLNGREVVLKAPVSEEIVRALRVGDVVLISGEVFTGRDAVHVHLMKHSPLVDMRGSILYHCGPVMLSQPDGWMVKAADPTTSSRQEPYQATIIDKYGVRAMIGKGGMGAKTLAVLQKSGSVYLNAIGGAAQFYARPGGAGAGSPIHRVGIPEAMWHLRVNSFAAIVTTDAHGTSLHADVESRTGTSSLNCGRRHGLVK